MTHKSYHWLTNYDNSISYYRRKLYRSVTEITPVNLKIQERHIAFVKTQIRLLLIWLQQCRKVEEKRDFLGTASVTLRLNYEYWHGHLDWQRHSTGGGGVQGSWQLHAGSGGSGGMKRGRRWSQIRSSTCRLGGVEMTQSTIPGGFKINPLHCTWTQAG